jgi:ABC-type oligopeptide transport system substrate-binding subunit/class 3 adenylate cyclase
MQVKSPRTAPTESLRPPMTDALLAALAAYIPRDRLEQIADPGRALAHEGAALIADISGFTPLTEALTRGLSADQGAEELTRALEGVFTPLVAEIHAFHGSVIKFSGDALIVWYPRQPGMRRAGVARRALTSAWRMQRAIAAHGQVPTPIGVVTLRMKIGLIYGAARRFALGLPELGLEDVLAGRTLDRMAEAEHHAAAGEIVTDAATLALAHGAAAAEWRDGFAVVRPLARPARRLPWPPVAWPAAGQAELLDRLAPFVPPQIEQALAAGQARVAELKPVVSLFVQFDGIDYDGDPAAGERLQAYFARAQQVVARYAGRLNRLIAGDKGSLLHIIFGAPRAVEQQEARAVRCALDLIQECGGLPSIAAQRIGISTGRVFAGPVGSPDRHDYTTMGDSINLSARLMQRAADDQIIVEAAVREAAGDEIVADDLGSVMVKGKAEPIAVFAARGVRELPRRAPLPAAPIVGRAAELALLERRLADLQAGRGGAAVLVGEVGMGKTLVLEALRDRAPVAWAGGAGLAYGASISGYLLIDALRDLLDLPPGVGPEAAGRRLAELCDELFGAGRRAATYPYLARFMGLPLEPELARQLDGLAGESLRWQVFELVRDLFRRLLRRGPLVLALDDLQWADPTSLELIELLLPLTAGAPLLLILAMRPERDARAGRLRQLLAESAGALGPALEIELGPLSRADAAELIARFAPRMSERLLDRLLEKGGGNPLFLVELMRTLQARGALAADMDAGAIDALDLPDTVQGLLLAQIDRLAVSARHTLQLAAVIGKTFLVSVLAALEAGERQLDQQLAALESDAYILPEERAGPAAAYTFRHILIQESAYGMLLYERRRAYHRAVAEALERLFPGQLPEWVGLLALHYERADLPDRAIGYHLQAADQARLLSANAEAEALYRRVLALLDQHAAAGAPDDLDLRARTYLKLAQVRSNALDFTAAQELYEVAFDLLERARAVGARATPVPAATPERAIRLGVFEHGPTTLDPGLSEASDISEIVEDLFEGLVEIDTELNVIPAAARRWSIDEGGRRYRFELRPRLRWSDGAPLTAHDFVFAWRRNLSPPTGAGMAYQLYAVAGAEELHQGQGADPEAVGIRALDDLTLEIALKAPASYFLYLLAAPIAFPQPAHSVRRHGSAWATPDNLVCNGPFRVARWRGGARIELARNPVYRGATPGNLDQVRLDFVEPTLERYDAGALDWCRVDREDVSARDPAELALVQYMQTFFLAFACRHAPFDSAAVRQAFAMSVDQRELVRGVTAGVQRPGLGGAVPPGMPGHSPELAPPYDPVAARELLRGISLPAITLAAPPGTATPRYLQERWREQLGVEVRLVENLPVDQIMARLSEGAVQIALIGWLADYPDPDSVLRVLFHSASPINYLGWRDAEFDALVERAATLADQPERMALYHQADRRLVAEAAAIVPLFYRQSYGLLRPRFRIAGAGKIIRGGTFRLKNLVAQ